ncbi:AMP-binding protein [Streptomyces sp. NPDC040724]|uniref:AMP-binding protein n=1 Tax=Streptomyces sp. NPDC040724 TaxID=3155612 RepID=UPI0033C07778
MGRRPPSRRPSVQSAAVEGAQRAAGREATGAGGGGAIGYRLGKLPCGRPVGQGVRVADPETGVEQAAGVIGELWLRGPNMAAGYWREEQRSSCAAICSASPASTTSPSPDRRADHTATDPGRGGPKIIYGTTLSLFFIYQDLPGLPIAFRVSGRFTVLPTS